MPHYQFTSLLAVHYHRIGPLLTAITFGLFSFFTWNKWVDVQVDYGRQLYIYWQMAQGKALYVDMASMHGPLADYFNMMLFRVAGVSISTLCYFNLGLSLLLTGLIYHYFQQTVGHLAATISSIVWIGMFCFAHEYVASCFNFIAPYNYNVTYGVFLTVVMLALLQRHLQHPQGYGFKLAGFCWGLIFLTKVETMVAATAAVGAYCLLVGGWQRALTIKDIIYFLISALVPVVAMTTWLASQMSWSMAIQGASGNWYHLFFGVTSNSLFYQQKLGLDNLSENLWVMAKYLLGDIIAIGALFILDKRLSLTSWRHSVIVACGTGLLLWATKLEWFDIARPLPVLMLVVLGALGWRLWQQRQDPIAVTRNIALIIWGVWGLGLLAKMAFRVMLSNYGFALALPATLLLVAVLVQLLPEYLAERYQRGRVMQAGGVGLIAVVFVAYMQAYGGRYIIKDFPVGSGGDQFVTFASEQDPRGPLIGQMLNIIETQVPATATMLSLPEGAMINYQARRRNSILYNSLVPYDMLVYGGEAAVLATIQQSPPDYILLIHREVKEYGFDYFGREDRYGKLIMNWINANYRQVALVGAPPNSSNLFGLALLQRQKVPSINDSKQ
jgi:Dolichyl-phosphate-mannose-protein mannosyltransferase